MTTSIVVQADSSPDKQVEVLVFSGEELMENAILESGEDKQFFMHYEDCRIFIEEKKKS